MALTALCIVSLAGCEAQSHADEPGNLCYRVTGRFYDEVTLLAPTAGTVIERMTSLGMDVEPAQEPLIDAINQLVKKIHEAQVFHKRFIANAAHQLRTPLSSLLLQIEYALRERDEQRHTHALEEAHRAVTRLQHVTRQLLTLMQSERQTASILQLKPLDLADLARGEVERFSDMALHREIDLGYEGPETEVIINGEAHLLRELIGNLLDNAIRYCPAHSTITLILPENPLCLSVLDDGPGIPPEEQRWVLERFYRGKTVIADGCGLGLSIADEIARRHQAKLSLHNGEAGKGTRIDIIFG